ncbi:MAG TPA: FtsX-like permease family protein, partial [Rhodobacteraceae bacterium]|nr:FtsX-like permease family protein [Paracoccaceae bacterium]
MKTDPGPADHLKRVNRWIVALRMAAREMRGGLGGFRVFLACILLGVAAIAGVNSFARALNEGVVGEGQILLGGDVALELTHREANDAERTFLKSRGQLSVIARSRAMARRGDGTDQALVEIKAVDGSYPLYGRLKMRSGGNIREILAADNGEEGVVVDPALLVRLGLRVGDAIEIGNGKFRIRDTIAAEPDRLVGGVGFGPRVIMRLADIRNIGLIRPGSLIHWLYRLRLEHDRDAEIAEVIQEIEKRFPEAGWEIRSRANAAPGLKRNINKFAQFLTLVGLTALMVGGVGIANAVRGFIDRKQEVIATLKCLGASGSMVIAIYLIQILFLAAAGILAGLVVGAALPAFASWALADVLPLPLAVGIYPRELAIAIAYGLLTTLAFAILPLGRALDIPVSVLFRDRIAAFGIRPRPIYVAVSFGAALTLALLAILFSEDRRIAVIYVVASLAAFALLRMVALAIMAAARRIKQVPTTELRLALANIHRPGALTPTIVLSLGLGLALLVALGQIDGNLRRALNTGLPRKAPSFFFLDIQNEERQTFLNFLRNRAPDAKVQSVPMLRGRIVSLAGIPVSEIDPPAHASWVFNGDRGIT